MALLARGCKTGLLDNDGLAAFDLLDARTHNWVERVPPARLGFQELQTWGVNDNFVLAHQHPDSRVLPEKVALFSNSLRVSVDHVVFAKYHTVILADGQVYTCGVGR